ncbi:hypothetical protein WA026_005603 [Henosepilachna vigintioctopunctata]|uniref:Uncharacterized protein n=1 Tax=Henosepilachna vigintioctopunctata TaxID=420089 RepID=A0AAW1TTE2_9CUCU
MLIPIKYVQLAAIVAFLGVTSCVADQGLFRAPLHPGKAIDDSTTEDPEKYIEHNIHTKLARNESAFPKSTAYSPRISVSVTLTFIILPVINYAFRSSYNSWK